MKAIITVLFLLASLTRVSAETPNLLKTKLSFEGSDVSVEDFFEFVNNNLETPVNIVFKGNAGSQKIPAVRLKDVTLGSLLKVIENVAEVKIDIVDDSVPDHPSNQDPFAAPAPSAARILSSSGILVVSSKRQAPTSVQKASNPYSANPGQPVLPTPAIAIETEVTSLASTEIEVDAFIDAITTAWKVVDPALALRSTITYHKATKLLIISGPKKALETARKITQALIPASKDSGFRARSALRSVIKPSSNPVESLPSSRSSNELVPRANPLPGLPEPTLVEPAPKGSFDFGR